MIQQREASGSICHPDASRLLLKGLFFQVCFDVAGYAAHERVDRFDRTEKLLERVLKKNNTLDGEEVLDNQDLCLLLKVGIRTLQRYRAIGVLPYFTISGKVFYRTKDVHEFIRTRFAEVEERAAKRKEKEARKAERRRKRGLFP